MRGCRIGRGKWEERDGMRREEGVSEGKREGRGERMSAFLGNRFSRGLVRGGEGGGIERMCVGSIWRGISEVECVDASWAEVEAGSRVLDSWV